MFVGSSVRCSSATMCRQWCADVYNAAMTQTQSKPGPFAYEVRGTTQAVDWEWPPRHRLKPVAIRVRAHSKTHAEGIARKKGIDVICVVPA